jgi:signal peptidase
MLRVVLIGLLVIVLGFIAAPLAVGSRALIVLSGSMVPAIQPGSIVIARPVPVSDLRIGDVIAYSPSANAPVPIVHRIISTRVEDGATYFTTRGDANYSADPAEVSLPGSAWRVWYSVPLVGYIVIRAASPLGALVFVGVPVVLLGISLGLEWIRDRRRAMPGSA